MRRICVIAVVTAGLSSGAALACEDMVMKDTMGLAPNATQKPLQLAKAATPAKPTAVVSRATPKSTAKSTEPAKPVQMVKGTGSSGG
jgi:hypothetical protein